MVGQGTDIDGGGRGIVDAPAGTVDAGRRALGRRGTL